MARRRGTEPGPATISDVARRVGVATSTVSRALTRPGRVSDALRLRVLAAAAELGYQPNPQARSLTSGRTGCVALLVQDVTNPYFCGLIRGTQTQLRSRGYRHLLVDLENNDEIEEAALAELPSAVDGMVVMGAHVSDDRLREVARRVPVVVINRELDGVPSVVVDTPSALEDALQYLVSLGHRRIAYAAGPKPSWSSRKRWAALQGAAERLGVTCERIGPFSPGKLAGAAAADAALHIGVTACIFFNDLLAIGALKRFAERGVAVPGDISVVGCDDIFGADFCNPPLTTITAPTEQVGRTATDMLLARLHPGDAETAALPERVKLPAPLTIRASVASARPAQAEPAPPRPAAALGETVS
ncbi:LacI family transcriptional regulator [Alsobacter sp. SYSU M60028]|uniref:LacI family transcriptional regulator n=1 Tax=Alsobacter ponti TaxID=2962936 RepID=A0ABT1LA16_9HYPH|nr:LacI family DNA-binding transcriptional regulator [Alsobacter ponti]MCP8938326.1 LacI family transcriptional regulator [Alsobacter ponti]